MTPLSATHPTLLNTLAPGNSLIRSAGFVIAGSLVLALSAKAQVPFWPVPMTLQSLAIMMIGMAYGSRLAAATVLLYLAEGLAGLPVFAGAGAGFAYMTGPTAGYLVGFVMAAGLIGWLNAAGTAAPSRRLPPCRSATSCCSSPASHGLRCCSVPRRPLRPA
jgi:biotin transport system substrate-specific component